jgi:hypothetical protein
MKVTFWKLLTGQIVAQKKTDFFCIPSGSPMGKCRETREKIAFAFDDAPYKESGITLIGANVIDTVAVC